MRRGTHATLGNTSLWFVPAIRARVEEQRYYTSHGAFMLLFQPCAANHFVSPQTMLARVDKLHSQSREGAIRPVS